MRLVILGPSLYSETTCAMAVQMARAGYVPCGALVLSTFNRATMTRKLGEWGLREVARYARSKLSARPGNGREETRNPYLLPLLTHAGGVLRSLKEVAARYSFPVTVCSDQNSPRSVARLRTWSPDLVIFTGGNILRKDLLRASPQGVLNVHLGWLPEIRGMSSPEWSLLKNVPVGVTIHYMDEGMDTGAILGRYRYPNAARCESLSDLRHGLIAFGIEKVAELVSSLDGDKISGQAQPHREKDDQHFVMHDWLRAQAMECLAKNRPTGDGPARGAGMLHR